MEWLYYNFAAGSFHTQKLCSRIYSIEIEFHKKITKHRFLRHPLGNLGVGNVCTLHVSIARCEACYALLIRHS